MATAHSALVQPRSHTRRPLTPTHDQCRARAEQPGRFYVPRCTPLRASRDALGSAKQSVHRSRSGPAAGLLGWSTGLSHAHLAARRPVLSHTTCTDCTALWRLHRDCVWRICGMRPCGGCGGHGGVGADWCFIHQSIICSSVFVSQEGTTSEGSGCGEGLTESLWFFDGYAGRRHGLVYACEHEWPSLQGASRCAGPGNAGIFACTATNEVARGQSGPSISSPLNDMG